MALSLSGPGTPPLCWEGGSRGRGSFQNSTCLLGSVGGRVGRGLYSREAVDLPCSQPSPSSRPHPHRQRQFQTTAAPAPLSENESQKTSRSFPIHSCKGPWDTPFPHPSPLEANEFPWRPPAGACLSVRLCVGEGAYVSAHRSLVWV